ncbi:MAG: DUF4339 domain-containing protein [Chthoniobacteraceae bacterium]
MQVEAFFIHHNGEQRGPYTAKQVNHLYKCNFIDDDTLYWREGLEQWHPVSQIVLRRKHKNRVLFWSILLGVMAAVALFFALFGPVTADAWRELTSGDFTPESAWWRARSLVREQIPKGAHVRFDPFASAQVTLQGKDRAAVILGGALTTSSGASEHGAWRVLLRYDESHMVWSPAPKPAGGAPAK